MSNGANLVQNMSPGKRKLYVKFYEHTQKNIYVVIEKMCEEREEENSTTPQ
jgi:hypothetical protein